MLIYKNYRLPGSLSSWKNENLPKKQEREFPKLCRVPLLRFLVGKDDGLHNDPIPFVSVGACFL